MIVLVQRSKNSKVLINNTVYNEIDNGLVLLVGFTFGDDKDKIAAMVKKIINLRIFDDQDGIMNKSIIDIKGKILSISQFTLYADTTKGNRPSYIKALPGKEAAKLYDLFNDQLNNYIPTLPGIFGSEMVVHINNDGPVTIILEN